MGRGRQDSSDQVDVHYYTTVQLSTVSTLSKLLITRQLFLLVKAHRSLSSQFLQSDLQDLTLLFVCVSGSFVGMGRMLHGVPLMFAVQLLQTVVIVPFPALPLEDSLELTAKPIDTRSNDSLLMIVLHPFTHYKIHYALTQTNNLDQNLIDILKVAQSFLKLSYSCLSIRWNIYCLPTFSSTDSFD